MCSKDFPWCARERNGPGTWDYGELFWPVPLVGRRRLGSHKIEEVYHAMAMSELL